MEVRVYRIRFSDEPYRRPGRRHHPREVAEQAPVHERSKKAGSHCVKLGDGKWCEPLDGATAGPRKVYIDDVQHPYIRFIFRYQPRAMLQAHGIIPRDRPSEPGAYHPHDYPLYMSGHAGPSSHYAHPPVKVEPRPLEERLGSEYYNDMQVEVRSYLALSFPFHCQMGQILLAGYAAFTKSATSATRSRAFCPAHPPARTCAPACSCA
ncbi:hypothetical protein FOMPIDRAFT_162455 [Fomitopsis schrenkii]|uniref:DUF7918 domain-containing protein n=1 Tax=Fomitopsis schrenkii TaxID=2126942 RepID=S8DVP3_FOMSC|nr:hypothetical protein FOMPIDRAFT_162455 [Fomitopsis schrenkii]